MRLTDIAIVGAILYFFARYQVGKINYSVLKSYVKSWEFDGVAIYTDIELKNSSDIPLALDGFEGSVFYTGREIAKVGLIRKLSVPAGENRVITVGAKIMYGPATGSILESIQRGRIESGIKVKGTLYAGNIKLPISYNYQLW